MAEARQVETEAATYLDQLARYHITRGKLISKVAKYPHVVSITDHRGKLISKVAKYPHVVSITQITEENSYLKWLNTLM